MHYDMTKVYYKYFGDGAAKSDLFFYYLLFSNSKFSDSFWKCTYTPGAEVKQVL